MQSKLSHKEQIKRTNETAPREQQMKFEHTTSTATSANSNNNATNKAQSCRNNKDTTLHKHTTTMFHM
jgi:hypothetical protein